MIRMYQREYPKSTAFLINCINVAICCLLLSFSISESINYGISRHNYLYTRSASCIVNEIVLNNATCFDICKKSAKKYDCYYGWWNVSLVVSNNHIHNSTINFNPMDNYEKTYTSLNQYNLNQNYTCWYHNLKDVKWNKSKDDIFKMHVIIVLWILTCAFFFFRNCNCIQIVT